MNVQLLLLLALVGPFCAFTHASPTELPPELQSEIPGATAAAEEATALVTEGLKEELTVITGPPPTKPAAAPAEVTEAEDVTEAAPASHTVNTEEAVLETEGSIVVATEIPEISITDAPAVETEAPIEPTAAGEPEGTAAAEAETGEEVVIEEGTYDGLSSGQVVGIVIGALLAVVIVIAVVIAVVRRMGKYSP